MTSYIAFKKLQELCKTYTENKRIDKEIVIIWRLFVFIHALKGSIVPRPLNTRDNDGNIILSPSYTLTRDKKNKNLNRRYIIDVTIDVNSNENETLVLYNKIQACNWCDELIPKLDEIDRLRQQYKDDDGSKDIDDCNDESCPYYECLNLDGEYYDRCLADIKYNSFPKKFSLPLYIKGAFTPNPKHRGDFLSFCNVCELN